MENIVKIYQGDKTLRCEATPWFTPDVKPYHKGLYNVGSDQISVLVEWDGEKWIRGDGSSKINQDLAWRGWTGRYL